MKRITIYLLAGLMLFVLAACGGEPPAVDSSAPPAAAPSNEATEPADTEPEAPATTDPIGNADAPDKTTDTQEDTTMEEIKVKITVGDTELTAVLENNSTTQALVEQMPMTLPMMDLYGREMCYRYGGGALPTDSLRSDRYEVGDLAYWPPAGSLVILYKQNGEEFERQHLGHIDEGVDVFSGIGDVDVTFELLEE